jgi:amino acid transporter
VVLPASKIQGIDGFVGAVNVVFGDVYGGAADFLVKVMVGGFIVSLITSGAVWMIGSDRIQAVAAYDGAFFSFFGVFNRRFGTPVRVNVLSGLASTAFCVTAITAFNSGSDATFQVVLDIAISTTLISYLWVFPAVIKLRYTHPHVHRPYRIPGDLTGMWLAAGITTFWTALGSFVAVFPGVLESLFGIDYNFRDTWGVSRATFEVLTLATLAVVFAIAVVGYWLGRSVREQVVEVRLDADLPPAPAAVT